MRLAELALLPQQGTGVDDATPVFANERGSELVLAQQETGTQFFSGFYARTVTVLSLRLLRGAIGVIHYSPARAAGWSPTWGYAGLAGLSRPPSPALCCRACVWSQSGRARP